MKIDSEKLKEWIKNNIIKCEDEYYKLNTDFNKTMCSSRSSAFLQVLQKISELEQEEVK